MFQRELPGLITFTIPKPIETAVNVVNKYNMIVLNPIFESWDIFFKSDTPFISDARIKGTAINFKTLIKIVPKVLSNLQLHVSQN